ncbi:MAG: hypothetical protein HC912_02415 [Saprospiraceae bacterium]|nr:hypothetical protein [Saprospiraceae bacterium]
MNELLAQWSTHKASMKQLVESDVVRFNQQYQQQALPAVIMPKVKDKP